MDFSLLECVPEATVVVHPAGAIVYLNANAAVMFGYTREELVGQAVDLLVPAHVAPARERHRQKYAATPHARPMGSGLELEAVRKDGSRLAVEISLSPLDIDGFRS